MSRYRIIHHYATLDDDGTMVVETEEVEDDNVLGVSAMIESMLTHPGGRSGTTITLTITALDDVTV